MKQIFTKKTLSDIAYWLLILSILGYLLYQKGWIFANFPTIEAKEAYSMLEEDDNVTLLDVRTPKEFKEDGSIANAKLIPLGVLHQNLQMLDKSKKVLIYCRSGNRSIRAARILEKQGFSVINLSGGIIDWKNSGFGVKK